MLHSSLWILVVIATQTLCYADVTKLSPEYRKALRDNSDFREVRATAILPPAIVALCADDRGRLAKPGQKWEATDFITDDSLPRRRLIWTVTGGDYYVVHYERGGYAHSFHVLVATLKQGQHQSDCGLAWGWRAPQELQGISRCIGK